MAFQQVPNTVEVSVHFTLASIPFLYTFHAENPGGYNQAALDTLAFQIDVGHAAAIKADLSNWVTYVRTDVQGLDLENDLFSSDNTNTGLCAIAGGSVTGQVAFVVSKRSGLSGRSARGRCFVGGIPRTYMQITAANNNLLTAAAAAAFVAHVDAARITIEAIGPWNAVIVSRYNNGTKRATGITFPWLTTINRTLKVGTQRGRLS